LRVFCSILGFAGATILLIVSAVNYGMMTIGPAPDGAVNDGTGYMYIGSLMLGFLGMGFAIAGIGSRSIVLGILLIAVGSLNALSFAVLDLKNGIDWSFVVFEVLLLVVLIAPGTASIIVGSRLVRRHKAQRLASS
jgi:hypothetical protein